jgi:hypothetical protein
MIKELLGVVERFDTRPLLVTFTALSFATYNRHGALLLVDPFNWYSLCLIFFIFAAYLSIYLWVLSIHNLNFGLKQNDILNWGLLIGCTILAFCILVIFSYLSSHPQGLTFTLLSKPAFIQVCSLFLLALETIKIKRMK